MKSILSFPCLMCLLILSSACGPRSPEREAAHVVSDEPAEAPPRRIFSGPAVSYLLSDASELNFTGHKVGGTQKGTFLFFDGTLTLQDDDPESLHIEVNFPMESIMTDDPGLAPVLLSERFFNAGVHPEGRFVSRQVAHNGDGYTVTGDLTLNGVTKTLSFPAAIELGENALSLNAGFQVDRQWWNLTWGGVGEYVMRDRVDIDINARAVRSDEG